MIDELRDATSFSSFRKRADMAHDPAGVKLLVSPEPEDPTPLLEPTRAIEELATHVRRQASKMENRPLPKVILVALDELQRDEAAAFDLMRHLITGMRTPTNTLSLISIAIPNPTPLIDSVEAIRERLAVGDEDPPAADAGDAMRDLMDWLHEGREEIGRLAGFSRRSSHYWDTGTRPRPATVRRLFEIHSVVASLVQALGRTRTRDWLRQPSRTIPTASRLELLGADDGIPVVTDEIASLLFDNARRGEPPRPESDERGIAVEAAEAYEPSAFEGSLRRARKVTGKPNR
jgi:hypothetical protein